MVEFSNLPDVNKLYSWYKIVGSPNRQELRDKDYELPDGATKSLIEALIPYFNSKDIKLIDELPVRCQGGESKSIVVTSDWHIPFQDDDVLKVFFNFLYEYQPDELILNGNINDMTSFSSHPRIRELANVFRDGKEERKKWFSIAELLRTILPDSKIVYIGSKCHEGWLDDWVQQSPILAEDDNYTLPGWLKLEDYSIEYVPEVYDPIGNKLLLVTHGTIARGQSGASARGSMDMEGTSVIVGHTHRLSQVFKTTAVGETVGLESGCMCQRTPWYHLKGKRMMMDWQQGFVLANFEGNSFSTNCVPIIRDSGDNPYFWVGKDKYK